MLAVAKKPHIEVRAKKIPQSLIDFLKENFGGVEIEKDSYTPEEIPELTEVRENTSPAEAIFINRDMREAWKCVWNRPRRIFQVLTFRSY